MAKAKSVATVAAKILATVDPIDALLAANAGQGYENATKDAFAIPFLRVLQDLSPQVKPKMSGYVKGAKVGDIYNTVTQECAEVLRVIPCAYARRFIEWVPRGKKNGGFVAAYEEARGLALADTGTRDGGKLVLPNGNELMDSREHYVLILAEDGSYSNALISMGSTALKVSRRWMTTIANAGASIGIPGAPSYAFSYAVTTEEEANDHGSWSTWVINDRQRVMDVAIINAAKAFYKSMSAGGVKVNYEEMLNSAGGKEEAQSAAPHGGLNDMDDETGGM